MEEKESKTRRKKKMLALQKMGERLVDLPKDQLINIPMPPELRELIYFAQSLKTHEAKRRHLQFIGKTMRHIDPELIQASLESIQMSHEKETQQFHQIELWREQLISKEEAAFAKLFTDYPHVDKDVLHELVKHAQHDRENKKKTGGESQLFDYLRSLLQTL